MSLKKPCGRFSANTLADFRPKLWPIFGQSFWSVFGQNLGRFPTKKNLNWIAPMGLGGRPFGATLAFANFYGEPSQFSREALPDFQPKLVFFLPKTKIRNQKRSRFLVENRPKKFDAEEPRLRARSQSEPPVASFRHNFLASFRPRFWPPNLRPKSENDWTEIGKRPGRNRKTAIRIFRKC